MLSLLYLFSLFTFCQSYYFDIQRNCDFNNEDSCLNSFYCSWCNMSLGNNSEIYQQKCIYNNICSDNFNKSDICVYTEDYKFSCNSLIFPSLI